MLVDQSGVINVLKIQHKSLPSGLRNNSDHAMPSKFIFLRSQKSDITRWERATYNIFLFFPSSVKCSYIYHDIKECPHHWQGHVSLVLSCQGQKSQHSIFECLLSQRKVISTSISQSTRWGRISAARRKIFRWSSLVITVGELRS